MSHLLNWTQVRREQGHEIQLTHRRSDLVGGDLLLLISCNEIVAADIRADYSATLVVHASDLPRGRGWSPFVWQVLEGAHGITVTLLEAEDAVDSGRIWGQEHVVLEGHELSDEINQMLFLAETRLMDYAVDHFADVSPREQQGQPTYYRRRTPEDSRLDPAASLEAQFDLLRVADPDRFPCFVDLRGHRYKVVLEKMPPVEGGLGAEGRTD